MNTYPGILGRKLGMTQIIADDGSVVAVTVIEAKPIVVGKRTKEKDGYDAVIFGLDERKEKHTSQPLAGQFKKAGVPARRVLREFRCDPAWAAGLEIGSAPSLTSLFEAGQMVDVRGVSRGMGFQGVMKRYNFKGSKNQTHGTHEYQRHGGSIGTRMTPGRVKLGTRMGGHMGAETVSLLNQKVLRVLDEEGLVLVRGGVPGARNGVVEVRGAIKKRGGKKA